MKKMMMKKSGWIAAIVVAVAILTTVALVIGCRPVVGHSGEQNLPGNIRVNFGYGGNGSRTVLPYDADITAFKIFHLLFSSAAGDINVYLDIDDFDTPTNPANIGKSRQFPMKAGVYTLLVTGYVDGSVSYAVPNDDYGAGTVIAGDMAGWWAGEVTVTGTAGQTIGDTADINPPIVLKGDTATGTGAFFYEITNSTTGVIKTASMTITPAGTTTSLTPLTAAVWTDTIAPINTGFYYLDFTFEREGSDPIYFRHVMQIYQNLTSKFIYDLTDDYFYITAVLVDITITFKPPTDDEFAPVITAAGLDLPSTFSPAYDVAYKVIEKTPAGGNITFTVTNFGNFDALEWYCNYYNAAPPGMLTASGNITAATFTLGAAAPFNKEGRYLVTVEGMVLAPSDDPEDPDYDYHGPFSTSFLVVVE